jgi:hypothetical protein
MLHHFPVLQMWQIPIIYVLLISPDFLQLTFTQQNKGLIRKKHQGRELIHHFSCANYISSH